MNCSVGLNEYFDVTWVCLVTIKTNQSVTELRNYLELTILIYVLPDH